MTNLFACLFYWPLKEFPYTLGTKISQSSVSMVNNAILEFKAHGHGLAQWNNECIDNFRIHHKERKEV